MKKYLICIPVLLLTGAVAAAQQKWGIVTGIGYSKVAGNNTTGAISNPLLVLEAAVFTMIPIGTKEVLVLKPSIAYAPRGVNYRNVVLTNADGDPIGAGDLKRRLDYIQLGLPLNYKMKWSKVTALVGAGPYAAYAISGREVKSTRFSQLYPSEKISNPVDFEKQAVSRFDAGIQGAFTAIFANNWCAGLKGELGFTNVKKEGAFSTRNQYVGVYFGYTF
jgi:hypothetical protein